MIDDGKLLALTQELSRAVSLVQEAVEEKVASDLGHGLPSIARERMQAGLDALARHETEVSGVRFALKRAVVELAGQSDKDAA